MMSCIQRADDLMLQSRGDDTKHEMYMNIPKSQAAYFSEPNTALYTSTTVHSQDSHHLPYYLVLVWPVPCNSQVAYRHLVSPVLCSTNKIATSHVAPVVKGRKVQVPSYLGIQYHSRP